MTPNTRKDLLTELALTFGRARIIEELGGALHPRLVGRVEVRGERDAVWRNLGIVGSESTSPIVVVRHPKALPEDTRRAAHLLADI